MTEEKLKKVERLEKGIESMRQSVRASSPLSVDAILIEEIDWLVKELKESWAAHKDLLDKEVQKLQKIDDFDSQC